MSVPLVILVDDTEESGQYIKAELQHREIQNADETYIYLYKPKEYYDTLEDAVKDM